MVRALPLLVVRVATTVAPPVDELTPIEALAPSRAVSLLGLAALAVPAGRDAHRIPIGVQLVGQVGAVLWVGPTTRGHAVVGLTSGRQRNSSGTS